MVDDGWCTAAVSVAARVVVVVWWSRMVIPSFRLSFNFFLLVVSLVLTSWTQTDPSLSHS